MHHYKRYRFPAEIIAYAMWLHFRFPLSLRYVEDLLAERGIEVWFQTVSEWASKFGREFACHIRSRSKGGFPERLGRAKLRLSPSHYSDVAFGAGSRPSAFGGEAR